MQPPADRWKRNGDLDGKAFVGLADSVFFASSCFDAGTTLANRFGLSAGLDLSEKIGSNVATSAAEQEQWRNSAISQVIRDLATPPIPRGENGVRCTGGASRYRILRRCRYEVFSSLEEDHSFLSHILYFGDERLSVLASFRYGPLFWEITAALVVVVPFLARFQPNTDVILT